MKAALRKSVEGDKDNPFRYWIKAKGSPPGVNDIKVRVKRADGTRGYSTIKFEMYPGGAHTQYHWVDPNGTIHNWGYYPEYAYLKKDGGFVK